MGVTNKIGSLRSICFGKIARGAADPPRKALVIRKFFLRDAIIKGIFDIQGGAEYNGCMTPADRYEAWLPRPISSVRESAPSIAPASISEIELQARWFSGEFGRSFTTLSGDAVEIVQFGEWNREAGPDFRGAAVSINGGWPVRGCIELDPDVRDWERHGHAVNPAYEKVILHLFLSVGPKVLFTQTLSGRAVPQVKLQIPNSDQAPLNPVLHAKCGRCSGALAAMQTGQVGDLLAAAAHFRMRRKAQRIGEVAEIHGEFAAPYPFLAETLGYKSNKLPFLLLAQRLPVSELRKMRGDLESVLFGSGGFLTATDFSEIPNDTKGYLRRLWESWWPHRTKFANLALSQRLWKCSGVRPMNHPQRRIGALAEIARRWPKVRDVLRSANPTAIHRYFASLRHDYWDFHYTLTSQPSPRRMALIGPERVNGMIMNVALPMALREHPAEFVKLQMLAAPDFNLKIRTAALRLFGVDAKRVTLLKSAMHQQGLLQIYNDFCCQDLSDCHQCVFPEQLAQWR
ncbi:MAG: DUF2851 family protein [Verrucomicrobia bacterium]|nr:DUF2851 family protein [Verrucomicrobiota bacterium]